MCIKFLTFSNKKLKWRIWWINNLFLFLRVFWIVNFLSIGIRVAHKHVLYSFVKCIKMIASILSFANIIRCPIPIFLHVTSSKIGPLLLLLWIYLLLWDWMKISILLSSFLSYWDLLKWSISKIKIFLKLVIHWNRNFFNINNIFSLLLLLSITLIDLKVTIFLV